ncbi:Rv0804 family intramembrane glutamic endopeptidase [Mycolicibacterium goodii]|uniref:Rv0804 family intramembrane glutamic endopeptidase n=1 Tax=Mycolicibacterium goodii TaxID=134601 RepID=UPI001BDCEDAE|nr:CPBP family intramembrane glutamic endopeptidase [Mycolicibacterium goodii]MBU8831549.1 CPBP family intramembrane metalloprotease [Mycolicibacterium goodii]
MAGIKIRALALAALLTVWNVVVDPRIPARIRPLVRVSVGTGLLGLTRTAPGLEPPAVWSGVRTGSIAAAAVASTVAAATALPPVRGAMRVRKRPPSVVSWLLLGIPLGTVWSEEAAFRGALGVMGTEAFGPAGGRLLQATAFGLSHIPDARATGEPVLGTVLVTGVAGWFLDWLMYRTQSLAAPLLVHLALNETGALGAVWYGRESARRR